MDALVIAEADDPSAWGDPIFVAASKHPRPAWMAQARHLDLAAKFFVLSVLHRMGLEATLTSSRTDNVDIAIVLQAGRALTVEVKTLSGVNEWRVSPFRAADHHYFIFVSYPPMEEVTVQPTVYVIASKRLRRLLARRKAQSLPLEVLAKETAGRDPWQELAIVPAA